jgi:hypothetical protein
MTGYMANFTVYPLGEKEVGWVLEAVWMPVKKKNFLPLPEIVI